jgi:hypothetical protein
MNAHNATFEKPRHQNQFAQRKSILLRTIFLGRNRIMARSGDRLPASVRSIAPPPRANQGKAVGWRTLRRTASAKDRNTQAFLYD